MTTEKRQFFSEALFTISYTFLPSSFAVNPTYFVQMEQYCARLSQTYKLSKAARN